MSPSPDAPDAAGVGATPQAVPIPGIDEPRDRYAGPAILLQGFRPFFLAAALWAAVSVALWLPILQGRIGLPSAFDPLFWHAHEMIFGFVAAAVAGLGRAACADRGCGGLHDPRGHDARDARPHQPRATGATVRISAICCSAQRLPGGESQFACVGFSGKTVRPRWSRRESYVIDVFSFIERQTIRRMRQAVGIAAWPDQTLVRLTRAAVTKSTTP